MNAGVQPPDEASLNDALSFWQRELHYYETRAGDQGRQAMGILGITAGAVATGAALIGNGASSGASGRPSWTLLVLPVLVVFLWATGLRLFHEMGILRTYTEHCGRQISQLSQRSPTLDNYRSWQEVGAKFDRPALHTALWAVSAVLMTAPGVLLPIAFFLSETAIAAFSWLIASLITAVALVVVLSLVVIGVENTEAAGAALLQGKQLDDVKPEPVLRFSDTGRFLVGCGSNLVRQATKVLRRCWDRLRARNNTAS